MLKKNRVVVKFGGEDLAVPDRVRRAADLIAKSGYREIVVVVSAVGKTTDQLLGFASLAGDGERSVESAEIISMGERTAARIMTSALRSAGCEARFFDPADADWPIVTNAQSHGATVDLVVTRKRVRKYVEPLLGKVVPVVCGFLGRVGKTVTTLGRGGSDTTAMVLANCLHAGEILLVKNTEGIHSADPRLVPGAGPLERLSIHEMFALAHGGAKVVRAESLRYKLPGQRLRIVSLHTKSLQKGGTEITGQFDPLKPVIQTHAGLAAVTGVAPDGHAWLARLTAGIAGRRVYGVTTGESSVTLFVEARELTQLLRRLHRSRAFRALATQDKIGLLSLTHPAFVDSPGGIAKVSSILFSRNINIIEMSTSKATIGVFVPEDRLAQAKLVLSEALEVSV